MAARIGEGVSATTGVRVVRIERDGSGFAAHGDDGRVWRGRRLILNLPPAQLLDLAGGLLSEAAGGLKVPVAELPARLAAITKELKELKKAKPATAAASLSVDELLAGAADVDGTRVVVADARGGDPGTRRSNLRVLTGDRRAHAQGDGGWQVDHCLSRPCHCP